MEGDCSRAAPDFGAGGANEARPLLSAIAGGLSASGTAIAGSSWSDVIVRQGYLEDLCTNLDTTGRPAKNRCPLSTGCTPNIHQPIRMVPREYITTVSSSLEFARD